MVLCTVHNLLTRRAGGAGLRGANSLTCCMCHRSGAAVWEAFLLPGGDITIDSGERAAFDSGLGVTRYRCAGKCGQPLYGEWGVGTDKHMAALSASFFVGGDAANEFPEHWPAPSLHMFYDGRHVDIKDGLPKFKGSAFTGDKPVDDDGNVIES